MSLIIFFGFSFFIFTLGVIVISATFYNWYKLAKQAKNASNSNLKPKENLDTNLLSRS